MKSIELLKQLRANYQRAGKLVEAKAIERAIAVLRRGNSTPARELAEAA